VPRRAGATLVEVAVALAVAGLVALTAHTGVAVLTRYVHQAEQHSRQAAQEAAVMGQLRDWFGSSAAVMTATRSRWEGVDRMTAAGYADDVIRFATLLTTPTSVLPVSVQIGIRRNGEAAGLTATFIPLALGFPEGHSATDAGNHAAAEVLLVPGATELDAMYLLVLGGSRTWVPEWNSATRHPHAIQLRIGTERGSAALMEPLTVLVLQ
jgi:hypothetical protein